GPIRGGWHGGFRGREPWRADGLAPAASRSGEGESGRFDQPHKGVTVAVRIIFGTVAHDRDRHPFRKGPEQAQGELLPAVRDLRIAGVVLGGSQNLGPIPGAEL